jgi:hypothetical protein
MVFFSQDFFDLLSNEGQGVMRRLDVVTVKGSEVPIGIYTYDALQDQIFKQDGQNRPSLNRGMTASTKGGGGAGGGSSAPPPPGTPNNFGASGASSKNNTPMPGASASGPLSPLPSQKAAPLLPAITEALGLPVLGTTPNNNNGGGSGTPSGTGTQSRVKTLFVLYDA